MDRQTLKRVLIDQSFNPNPDRALPVHKSPHRVPGGGTELREPPHYGTQYGIEFSGVGREQLTGRIARQRPRGPIEN